MAEKKPAAKAASSKKTLTVRQIKSAARKPDIQAATLRGLGLGKIRRDAEFTFVTFQDGRPVGLQPVTVRTTGEMIVAPYTSLDLG